MPALRLVLDANVIISALIRPDSAPGRVLRSAVEGAKVRLVTSPPLLAELRAAFDYKRLQRYLKMDGSAKEAFMILLEQIADSISIDEYPSTGACRDPDDEPYLHTARAGHVDYIVSGDSDLLNMKQVEGIMIVSPAECDRILKGSRQPAR